MATDKIKSLLNKVENGAANDAGVLRAEEFVNLVQAVIDNDAAISNAIKGIRYDGTLQPVTNGIVEISSESAQMYKVAIGIPEGYNMPSTIAAGSDCNFTFKVSIEAKDDLTGEFKPITASATVNIYEASSSRPIATVAQVYHGETYSVNISKYLSSGVVNKVYATMTFAPTATESYTRTTIPQEVNVVSFALTITSPVDIITSSTRDYGYIVSVTGDKASFVVTVDGRSVTIDDVINAGTPNSQLVENIIKQYGTGHGPHTFTIQAKAQSYENILTPVQTFKYLYIDENNNSPIIISSVPDMSEYVEYGNIIVDYTAYYKGLNGNYPVRISVYSADMNPDGSIKYDADGNLVNATELVYVQPDIVFANGQSANNKTSVSLFGNTELPGTRILRILITSQDGTVSAYNDARIVIAPSNIDMNPVENADVVLSSLNKTNADGANWENEGNAGPIQIDFEGFEFTESGSGWNPVNGTSACCIKKGRKVRIHHKPFQFGPMVNYGTSGETSSMGKTISFQFTTKNCINKDTSVIRCKDENGIGIEIFANKLVVKGSNASANLVCDFQENTTIKVDLVIQAPKRPYKIKTYGWPKNADGTDNDDGEQTIWEQETNEALAIVYIDGVYQGLSSLDNITYKQSRALTKEDIDANPDILGDYSAGEEDPRYTGEIVEIGSPDCDIDLYTFRSYPFDLSVEQILTNFAYDNPDSAQKIEIFKRNNIFDGLDSTGRPHISLKKLTEARPDLPQIYLQLHESTKGILPYDKSDWRKLLYTELDNPYNKNPEDGSGANAPSFTSVGQFKNQGTSSMNYPWPWRNWDWKTAKSGAEYNADIFKGTDTTKFLLWPYAEGKVEESKWPQYFGMPKSGISKITFKKDYASSEMCNNSICSDLFDYMAKGAASVDSKWDSCLSPTMQEEKKKENQSVGWENYRLALKAIPSFMWHDVNGDKSVLEPLGMMNIIPNKNEVKYLGMDIDGYNKWDGVANRAQSWEICENKTFWMPTEYIEYNERTGDFNVPEFWDSTNKTIINPIDGMYEARYPKDSTVNWGKDSEGEDIEADFGMTPKGFKGVNKDQFRDWYNEIADILDFHNWACSVNRAGATGAKLDKPVTYGDIVYDSDTADYRLAKFKEESQTRLIVNQWLLYYLWREQFWMFDSGSKNLQIYTMGPAKNADGTECPYMQWGCMVRDADTALGIDNQGVLKFPPYLEDTDVYKEEHGEYVFNYGFADGKYDPADITGAGWLPVLNGQLSSLWLNLRDTYATDLQNLYKALCATGNTRPFNQKSIIERFDNHQAEWCEALYDFGMSQYYGGPEFTKWIKSGVGNKKHQRKSWLTNAILYRRSKYMAIGDADRLSIRRTFYVSADGVDNSSLDVVVKPYSPMYVGISVTSSGSESVTDSNKIRVIDCEQGARYPALTFFEGGAGSADAHTYLFGISNITDIGDMARFCKITTLTGLNSSKLLSLKLGDHTRTYQELDSNGNRVPFSNGSMTELNCSGLPSLTYIDVTNHTALKTLNIANNLQLKEVYAQDTACTSIILPQTSTLKTIWLGSKLNELRFIGLTGVEQPTEVNGFVTDTIKIDSLKDVTDIYIKDCGAYINSKSWDWVSGVVNKGEGNVIKSCIVYGCNWMNATSAVLEKLLDTIKDNSKLILTGRIHIAEKISTAFKTKLLNRFPAGIDDPNGAIYITYQNVSVDSLSVPKKLYATTVGRNVNVSIITNPAGANNFTKFTLSWDPNVAGMASLYGEWNDNGSLTVLKVGTEQEKPEFGYRCQVLLANGETITATGVIAFYNRKSKVGDVVYHDGSTSDVDDFDTTKTPVGICFYIEPLTQDDIDAGKKPLQLMCALNDVNVNEYCRVWGLYETNYGNAGVDWETGVRDVVISVDDSVKPYDITYINNCGKAIGDADNNSYGDTFYDLRSSGTADAEGWTSFDMLAAASQIGMYNYGSKYPKKAAYYEAYQKNGSAPYGQYFTAGILETRDYVLEEFDLPKPATTGVETTALSNAIYSAMNSDKSEHPYADNYALLYYPAASYCYAYTPTTTEPNLIAKFKSHNWWLPSFGEMVRLGYYAFVYHCSLATEEAKNYLTDKSANSFTTNDPVHPEFIGNPLNIFEKIMNSDAYKSGKLPFTVPQISTMYVTSSEYIGSNDKVNQFYSVYVNDDIPYNRRYVGPDGDTIEHDGTTYTKRTFKEHYRLWGSDSTKWASGFAFTNPETTQYDLYNKAVGIVSPANNVWMPYIQKYVADISESSAISQQSKNSRYGGLRPICKF